ncbi:iron chelate uptake ABC transporter family permease subunit, partial [Pseudomonas aeruginosa]|uniref:iron chelate uptake ABC transporter family permease subunit n=1 Tax=Pseudomonas aeruginosa TaxID=287 RepID=UPI0031B6EFB9
LRIVSQLNAPTLLPTIIYYYGVLLLMAVVVALSFGRYAQGWTWASGALLEDLMPWRWPRIMAALFAGVMLAVAGCIIQRLTGNPMASPEVLGISSGAPATGGG